MESKRRVDIMTQKRNEKKQERKRIFTNLLMIVILVAVLIGIGVQPNLAGAARDTLSSLAIRITNLENRVTVLEGYHSSTTTTLPSTTTTINPTTTTTSPTTTTSSTSTTIITPTTTTSTTLPPTTTSSTTTTTNPPGTYTSTVDLESGLRISNALFTRASLDSSARGLSGSGFNDIVLTNIRGSNLKELIKVGSGPQSRNLMVDGLSVENTYGAMFIANLSDSSFRNITANVVTNGSTNHGMYLERGNHKLSFYNVNIQGGGGYGIHMYNYETASQPSDTITIDGGTIVRESRSPIIISTGYSNVVIRNLKMTGPSSYPIIQLYGSPTDVIVEDFEAWGGSALVGVTKDGNPINITFRNGIYHGSTLIDSADESDITNLTFENVQIVP